MVGFGPQGERLPQSPAGIGAGCGVDNRGGSAAEKKLGQKRWLLRGQWEKWRLHPWTDQERVAKEAREKGVVRDMKIEEAGKALVLMEVGADGKILRRSPDLPPFPLSAGWMLRTPIQWLLLAQETSPQCPYAAVLAGDPGR